MDSLTEAVARNLVYVEADLMRRVLSFAALLFAAAVKFRKACGLSLGTALTFAVAVSPASGTPFAGTLGISIGTFGTPPFLAAGGGKSTANLVTVPAGVFMGSGSVSGTAISPITAIAVKIASNGAGAFTGSPLTGPIRFFGVAAIKGDLGGGPITLVSVPLYTAHIPGSAPGGNGFGYGGSFAYHAPTSAYHAPKFYLNVWNTPWGEMRTAFGLQYTYTYHVPTGDAASDSIAHRYTNGTAMYTGTDSRTPGGLGQLTLVSPTIVRIDLTGGPRVFVLLGTLTLNFFVPEPGTLLLVGSGVAALVIMGRWRMYRE